ncbi:MAG: PilZ domain-containing protein [Desulfobaccales bacterium]|nr:PilZ domain-containing protein [Desulfobaccales bacterium]
MSSPMENRRFGRLLLPLSMEYNIRLPDSGEYHSGQGVTRDISLSGAYILCEPPTPLMPGQILDLTIAAPLPYLDIDEVSHLKAQGEVLRLDPPVLAGQHYGVAISFLDGLSFASP